MVRPAATVSPRELMLARVGALFDDLASRPGIDDIVPSYGKFHQELLVARDTGDEDRIETALARLYCVAHGSGGAYAEAERTEFDKLGGYWCHAGGSSRCTSPRPSSLPKRDSSTTAPATACRGCSSSTSSPIG